MLAMRALLSLVKILIFLRNWFLAAGGLFRVAGFQRLKRKLFGFNFNKDKK